MADSSENHSHRDGDRDDHWDDDDWEYDDGNWNDDDDDDDWDYDYSGDNEDWDHDGHVERHRRRRRRRRTITVSLADQTKAYDGSGYTGTVTYSGFRRRHDESILSGTLSFIDDGTDVGTYPSVTGQGLSDPTGRYRIVYESAVLEITKAPLTITAENKTAPYDGSVYDDGFSVRYSDSFADDENESVLCGTVSFETLSGGAAVDATNAGTYTIRASGLTSDNYDISWVDGTLEITQSTVTLTVSLADQSKVYNGSGYAGTVTYSGFVAGDDESILSGTLSFTNDGTDVGTYTGVTGQGLNDPTGKYTIIYDTATLEITAATIVVTLDDQWKTYDGLGYSGTPTYAGFVSSETDSVIDAGGLTYTGDGTSVGTHTITASGLSATNYTFDYTDTAILTITTLVLVLDFVANDKTYDGTTDATGTVSIASGVLGSDVVSVSNSSMAFASADVSTGITVTASGLSLAGASAGNYTLGSDAVTDTADITAATIVVTLADQSKTYDGLGYSGTPTYAGFVNSETDSVIDAGGLAFGGDGNNVGTHTVTASGLSATNYTFDYFDTAILTITAATLSVGLAADDKTYDGTTDATGTVTIVSAVIGVVSVSSSAMSFASADVSTGITVTASGLSLGGAAAGNYTLGATPVTDTADITAKSLTITAENKTAVYDGSTHEGEFTANYAGFITGEDEDDLDGSLSYGGAAATAVDAGTHTITPSGVTSTNYDITFVDGTLTITAATLSVSLAADDKTYDGTTDATGTVTIISAVIGVVSVNSSAMAFASADVNTGITVTASGLSLGGAAASNYTLGATSVTDTADITAATIVVTLADQSKTYDGSGYSGTHSYAGFVNSETDSVIDAGGLTFTGDGINVGTHTITASGLSATNYTFDYSDTAILTITAATLSVSLAANDKTYDGTTDATGTVTIISTVIGVVSVSSSAMSFASADVSTGITVTASGLSLGGAAAGNYMLGSDTVTDTADITAKSLTITAENTTAVYDGSTHEGDFTASYAGFITGEDKDDLDGSLSYGGAAKTAVNAGEHAITPSGFTSTNYDITFVDGTLTITAATLSVSLAADDKTYDGTTDATGAVTIISTVIGVVTVNSSAMSFASADAGAGITVTASGLSLSGAAAGNYTLGATSVTDNADITAKSLTITAENTTAVYDGSTHEGDFTASYAGFVTGEDKDDLDGSLSYGGAAATAVDAGTHTITPSGVTSTNYDITFVDGTLTITAATLSVSLAADDKTYDGTTDAAGAVTIISAVIGVVSVSSSAMSFASADVNTGITVTASGLSLGGAAAGNYTLGSDTITDTADITAATIIVTLADQSKTYDGSGYSETPSYAGFVNSETDSVIDAGGLTYTGDGTNVGTYNTVTASGLSATNYIFDYSDTAILTITAATLSVSLAADDKTYDGTTDATGTVTIISTVIGVVSVSSSAMSFASADVNTGITVTASGLSLSGAAAGNYTLGATSVTDTADITAVTIVVTLPDQTKAYDGSGYSGTASYAGFVGSETESLFSGTLTFSGDGTNVGTYNTVTASGLSATNYVFDYSDTAILTVTAATLSVSLAADNKTYDGTTDATGTVTIVSAVIGVVSVASSAMSFASADVNTGITVTANGLSLGGAAAGNYTLGSATATDTADITAATIVVTIDDQTKAYDGSGYSGTPSYAGFVNSETDSVIDESSLAFSGDGTNVGTYNTVTASGLSATNYVFDYSDTAILTITAATLSVSLAADNKTYDGTTDATGTVTIVSAVIGVVSVSSSAMSFASADVNTGITVTASGLSLGGAAAGNYTLGSATATNTADITAATIVVTLDDQTKAYDGSGYSGTPTYAGFVNSETDSVVDESSLAFSGDGTNVGTYNTVTASGLSATNYVFDYTDTAKLTITAVTIVVTLPDQTKAYDGSGYSGTASYAGFVGSETESLFSGTLTFTGDGTNVGTYNTVTASGLSATNYVFDYSDTAKLTITAVTIVVTLPDQTKAYNGSGYSGTASYAGFVGSETESLFSGTLTFSGDGTNVGTYNTVTASGLSATNYVFDYSDTAKLTITAVTIVVTLPDQTKAYDGSGYSGTASYAGFVGSETESLFSGTLTFSGDGTDVGTYSTVTASGLSATNYVFDYTDTAKLTITAVTIVVTLPDQTKAYDGSGYSGTASYAGFVGSETESLFSGTLTFSGDGTDVGTYNTVTASGLSATNYVFDYSDTAKLTITAVTIVVTLPDQTKAYDGSGYSGTASYAGFVGSETESLFSGTLTFSGDGSNVGTYNTVTASGLSATNYVFDYSDTAILTITAATLSVSLAADNKTYDGTTDATGTVTIVSAVIGVVSVASSAMAFASADVNTGITVTANGLSLGGAAAGNYTLGSATATDTADITAATIVVTIDDQTKAYDGSGYSGTPSYAGFVNSETDSVIDESSLAFSGDGTNVGTYNTVTASGLSATNYVFDYSDTAILTITAATLSVSLAADNKTYDGTTDATGTVTIVSAVIGVVSVSSSAMSFASADVNTGITVTASGLSLGGAAAGNYTLGSATATNTADITAATIVVTLDDQTKAYDGSGYSGTPTYAGFVNSETDSVVDESSLAFSGDGTNVGTYNTVTASGLSATNYVFDYSDTAVLTITALALVLNFVANDKTYDGTTDATGTVSIASGVLGSDAVSVSNSSMAFASADVSTGITVTASGLSLGGAAAGNYTLGSDTLTDTADITAKSLTITAENKTAVYDGSTHEGDFTASYAGFVTGESAGHLGGTLTYGGAAKTAVNAGEHAITLSGFTSINYAITFVDGALTISQVALTITADDKSAVYDGAAYDGGFTASYVGFVAGESAGDLGGTLTYGGAAKTAVNAGEHTITLSGFTSTNYTITFVDGTLTISQRPLTVTLTAVDKAHDGNTTATGTVTIVSGIVSEDVVTIGSHSQSFADANPGTWTVTLNSVTLSGTDSSNYTVSLPVTTSAAISYVYIKTSADTTVDAELDEDTTDSSVSSVDGGDPRSFSLRIDDSSSNLSAYFRLGGYTSATEAALGKGNETARDFYPKKFIDTYKNSDVAYQYAATSDTVSGDDEGGICISTTGHMLVLARENLYLQSREDMNIASGETISIKSAKNIDINAGETAKKGTADVDINCKNLVKKFDEYKTEVFFGKEKFESKYESKFHSKNSYVKIKFTDEFKCTYGIQIKKYTGFDLTIWAGFDVTLAPMADFSAFAIVIMQWYLSNWIVGIDWEQSFFRFNSIGNGFYRRAACTRYRNVHAVKNNLELTKTQMDIVMAQCVVRTENLRAQKRMLTLRLAGLRNQL